MSEYSDRVPIGGLGEGEPGKLFRLAILNLEDDGRTLHEIKQTYRHDRFYNNYTSR